MSSLNVTIPVDARVKTSATEALPIVPPSLISRSSANVSICDALKVAAVLPPVAIVITSEPENVIELFESPSPDIESSEILPTLEISKSPKSPSALSRALLIYASSNVLILASNSCIVFTNKGTSLDWSIV